MKHKRRLVVASFGLTVWALAGAAPGLAQDVTDPVDPLEDKALRAEAAARFDEALADFQQAFHTAVEQAQQGGEVRTMNLARAEVFLEKLGSLTETTSKAADTGRFLGKYDEAKVGPLLKGHLDWHRARFLMSEGNREGARTLADGLGLARDWWVIGPFDNERGKNFKTSQPVERKIDLGAELQGKERKVRWRKVPVQPLFGTVDLDAILRPNDQALAYAAAFVKSTKDQDAAVRVGSDEALRVWWNDSEVISRDARREMGFDQDVAAVHLNEGWNVVLLKVHDQTGPWSFRMRLTTPEGGKLDGITFATDDAAAGEALKGDVKAAAPQAAAAGGAKAWFDQATSGTAKKARDLFHLGYLHHRRDFDSVADRKAANLLKQAADAEPSNAIYRFHYAEAAAPPIDLAVEKEENRQRIGREKALELDPRYALAYRALAAYYTNSLVNLERAEEMLRKALDVNPAYVEARLDLANVLQRRGLTAESEVERDRALDDTRAATLESAARAKAGLLESRGMRHEALDAWKEVLRLDATGNDVRRRVAELAAESLQRDDAFAVLDAISLQNPYELSAIRRKADLLEGADDFAGAEKALRQALEIAPEDDDVLQQLGRVQAKSGDRAAALKTFRLALDLNPKLQKLERYVEFLDPDAAPFEDDYVVDVQPLLERAAGWDNKENDGWLTVLEQTVTKVNRDCTSSNYVREVHRILTDAGVKRFRGYFAQGWGQLKWKWARVTRPDGSVVDAKVSGSMATFPPLNAGDVIDIAYRRDDREQSYFGDYFGDVQYFASNVPVLRNEYTLVTPAERPFYFHQRNFDVKPVVAETEKDGRKLRTYTWIALDAAKVRPEILMPAPGEAFPQVKVTTYKDWNEFARWWWNMIRDQRILTDEMKAKVAEVVKGRDTRYEKIRAIYEFVAGEVTYQAVPEGTHGWKPYTTSAIFEKREGDCKDTALLMCTLFQEIGVEAFPVLIDRIEMGRSEEDLSIPMLRFNHCIAYVPDSDGKGSPLYLDGTNQYGSAALPPMGDRGGKVVIVKPDGAELATVPAGDPSDFGITQKWKFTLRPDGGATAEGEVRFRGDLATQTRQDFSVEGQRTAKLEGLFTPLFGKLQIEKIDFDDLKDLSKPEAAFRVTLDVPGFAKQSGDSMTLPAAFVGQTFVGSFAQIAGRPSRDHDLMVPVQVGFDVDIAYVLPEGWTLESKPEDAELKAPAGAFSVKTSQQANELRLERHFELSGKRVKREEYAVFRETVNRMAAAAGQRFKVKAGAAPAAVEPPKSPAEPPK